MQIRTRAAGGRYGVLLIPLLLTIVAAAQKPAAPGAPVVSEPRGAANGPITVVVFGDFESFLCARAAAVLNGILAKSDDVRLVFKHAPAASNPNSALAHEAALAAGAQGKFWEMHDLLFENQARLSRANLIEDARLLGLNLASFQRALDQHTYRPVVERDLVEANGLGVTSTPAFFINGRRLVGPQGPDVLQAVVDSVRDALPKNRSDAIVSSNPAPAIRLEHAPAKGPAAAPVSIVEFSDFECSYCAQILPVIRQVLAAHPAQIRFSFKHYPLPLHKQSQLAHEAAAAAGDQGKFWEMHDLIFAGGDKLGRDVLIGYAKRLNLDLPRFSKDLDSHRFKAAVESDRQEGDRLGVDAAPFFFVNGHAVSGAIGLADFEKLIGAALKETAPPRAK